MEYSDAVAESAINAVEGASSRLTSLFKSAARTKLAESPSSTARIVREAWVCSETVLVVQLKSLRKFIHMVKQTIHRSAQSGEKHLQLVRDKNSGAVRFEPVKPRVEARRRARKVKALVTKRNRRALPGTNS